MTEPLLDIRDLRVKLPDGAERSHAVRDVSLALAPNEILCVVGESGSGKSVMARSTMRLLPRRVSIESGQILFEGEDLAAASEAHMRGLRGSRISMIFQEPMTALNPLHTVGRQIDENLLLHTTLGRRERRERILDVLADVHLPDPARIIDAYRVMKMTPVPCSRCSSAMRCRICACVVTSSAVVGSSAMSTRGSRMSAMAIIPRCRWPPDRRNG